MYSIFDIFSDNPSYRSVYIISDSDMKELKTIYHQEELDGIINHKERREEAYKSQVKHLEEIEK
tara:strand:- start:1546 stop:1737 length:192 start_codon:yes stop_codon:yes gene_type:complete